MVHLNTILDMQKNGQIMMMIINLWSVSELKFFIFIIPIIKIYCEKLWLWNKFVLQPHTPQMWKGILGKRIIDWKPSLYKHICIYTKSKFILHVYCPFYLKIIKQNPFKIHLDFLIPFVYDFVFSFEVAMC